MKRLITNVGLLQIFFALLIVMMVMFVSNYIVHRNSIAGIYDKVSQNNTLVVKTMIQSFDNSFRTIDSLIHSIHALPYNNVIEADGRTDMAKIYDLQKNVTTLVSSIDFIEDVVVFYDNMDLAVTSYGTSSLTEIFEKKYKHDLYDAEYWKEYMRSPRAGKVFPAETFSIQNETINQKKKKDLMVITGGNKVRLSDKNIMLLIDAEEWLSYVNQNAMIPGSSFIVLDPNRNVILSTDQSFDLVEVLNDVYFNVEEQSVTRKNFEYNIYRSDYNDFIYIDKVPYQFMNIDSVNKANQTIMITAIISTIILSFLLSIYLYKPVKNILQQLGIGNHRGNDFRNIHKGILQIQTENKRLRDQLDTVDEEIRRAAFLRALDEYAEPSEYEHLIHKYLPEMYVQKQFAMVLFHLHPKEAEQGHHVHVEEIEVILASGLKRELLDVPVFHIGSLYFIALVGLENSAARHTLFKQLRSFKNRTDEELRHYVIWACVSKLYASEVANCKRAYRDVANGAAYRHVNDSVFVMDVEQIEYTCGIYYPLEKMEKLSNYLLSGKMTDAVKIVTETIQENIDRNIHRHQMEHVVKAMFYDMLRHTGNGSADSKALYQLETDFLQQLEQADHPSDMERGLVKVAKFLANQSKGEQKSKLNPAFISQYIDLHYMENLYLDHMAEVLETSPKYFSNYFKKTFGVNYVEYLNKVRLSHARELLKDSNLTIAEVGEKTGYQNSSTFTTTFKKYFGISPSDYRKKTSP
ncbi:helix-turn-helix transcriptional regulator [Marinicrinis lubricantis]|uniref:Helix-turn-helix transcriptional regulator n=1 Tax=Marinicrinis lubricantis TaxID=2086470 RepID=A0ABW1IRI1_9BACL